MAQDTSSSSAEDSLRKRINDWLASPEASRHFEEGFAQGGGLASNWFEHHQEAPSGPEGLPAGGQASPPLRREAVCRLDGHKWHDVAFQSFDAHTEKYRCERCGLVREVVAGQGPNITHYDIPAGDWICFYCGSEFRSEDSLLDHEDDCAEA